MLDDILLEILDAAHDRYSKILDNKLVVSMVGFAAGAFPVFRKISLNNMSLTLKLDKEIPDVYDPKNLTKHVWISGVQGTGKSNKLRRIFINTFVKQGWGGIYIDTHGTADIIMASIPPERWKDVIYIAPWMGRIYGINILQRYNLDDPGEVDRISEDVVDVFSKMYPRSWGDKLANCIRFATKAVLIKQEKLKEYNPTLMDVYRILKDELYRDYILEDCDNEIVNGFFEALKAHQATGKLENPLSSENVILALCQKSGFSMLDAMNEKKIIICNLDSNYLSTHANLIAGMLIAVINKCAAKRKEDDAARSPYFAVAMDEFHEYANRHISSLISQMRKKNVCVMLANQYREQTPNKDVQSAISMCQSKFIHRPADEDAAWVSNIYKEDFTKDQITKMQFFTCIHDEHNPLEERKPYMTKVPPFIADYNWSYVHKLKYCSLSFAPKRYELLEELRKEKEELILKSQENNDNSGDIEDDNGDIDLI